MSNPIAVLCSKIYLIKINEYIKLLFYHICNTEPVTVLNPGIGKTFSVDSGRVHSAIAVFMAEFGSVTAFSHNQPKRG